MTDGRAQGDSSTGGRQRILAAAGEAFSTGGYAGTSIAAIARRAGVSKSTVFHHFASKEALYLAVISEAIEDFGQRLEGIFSVGDDPARALLRFQQEHLRHMARHRQVARLILRELQDPAVVHKRARILDLLSSNLDRVVRYLESARAGGRIRPSVNCQVTALVMFIVNAFLFQHADDLAGRSDLLPAGDFDRIAQAVTDLLYNGLAPEAANGVKQ